MTPSQLYVFMPPNLGGFFICRSYYPSDFFFSSRRRHTRSLCDWSSDVCSSDLRVGFHPPALLTAFFDDHHHVADGVNRSEERRVGKESGTRWVLALFRIRNNRQD